MKHDPEALLAAVRELDAQTKALEAAINVLGSNQDLDMALAIIILSDAKAKLKADFKAPKRKAKRQPVGELVESSFDYLATTTSQNVAMWAKDNNLNLASVRKAIARQEKTRQPVAPA